jgi:hypothetical protein
MFLHKGLIVYSLLSTILNVRLLGRRGMRGAGVSSEHPGAMEAILSFRSSPWNHKVSPWSYGAHPGAMVFTLEL